MATQVGKLKNEGSQSHSAPLGESGITARISAFFAELFNRVAEFPRRWRGFLHEVRVEMRQVTWPTRHEVFVTTWVVMVTVAFFGVFFFGVDSGVSWLVQRIIKLFAH